MFEYFLIRVVKAAGGYDAYVVKHYTVQDNGLAVNAAAEEIFREAATMTALVLARAAIQAIAPSARRSTYRPPDTSVQEVWL